MPGRGARIPLRPDDPWAGATWPLARWDTSELALVGLMPFGLVYLAQVVVIGQFGRFDEGVGVLLTLVQQFALGLGVAWWVRERYGAVAPLGLRRRAWSGADVGAGIGFGFATLFAGGIVILATIAIVEALGGDTPAPRDALTEFGDAWRAVTIAMALFVAPWCEEIFFRGFLFGGLRRRWRFRWAALASGVGFALIHADPIRLPGLTVMGVLLALAYERRRTLVASVAAHTTVNAIAVVVSLLPGVR